MLLKDPNDLHLTFSLLWKRKRTKKNTKMKCLHLQNILKQVKKSEKCKKRDPTPQKFYKTFLSKSDS